MSEFAVNERALFGCALCNDGVVVFESRHIFPDIQDSGDLFGCDPTSRTEPQLLGGGVIFLPHPTPDWNIGSLSQVSPDGRSRRLAAANSAICARCLEDNDTVRKLLANKRMAVTAKLVRY